MNEIHLIHWIYHLFLEVYLQQHYAFALFSVQPIMYHRSDFGSGHWRMPSQRWYEVTQNSPIPPRCKAFWNCSGTIQCTSDLFPKRPVAVFRETKKNVGSIYLIIFNGEKKTDIVRLAPQSVFAGFFSFVFYARSSGMALNFTRTCVANELSLILFLNGSDVPGKKKGKHTTIIFISNF